MLETVIAVRKRRPDPCGGKRLQSLRAAVCGRKLPDAAALRKRGRETPTILPGRSDTAPRCAGPTGAGSRCAGQKCGAAPGVRGQGLFGGGRLRYAPKTGRQMFYTANGNSSHANQTFLCSFFRLPIRRTVFMVKIQSVFTLIGNSFLKRSAKEACRMFIRRRPSDATAV